MPRRAKFEPKPKDGKWTLNVPKKFSPTGARQRPTFDTRALADQHAKTLRSFADKKKAAAPTPAMVEWEAHLADSEAEFNQRLKPRVEGSRPNIEIQTEVTEARLPAPGWVKEEVARLLKSGISPDEMIEALQLFALYRKGTVLDPIEALEDRSRLLLAEIRAVTESDAKEPEKAIRALRNIGLAATRLLERIAHSRHDHIRAATEKLANESGSWPATISAIEERWSESFEELRSLGIGISLPFRVQASQRRGRPRSMLDGQAALALEVAIDLHNEKSDATAFGHSTDYMKRLTGPRAATWKTKAALLPSFDGKSKTQAKWLQAGMLWAEEACGGNWQDHPWPPRILNCLRYHAKGEVAPRGPKSAFRIALKAGLRVLVKT